MGILMQRLNARLHMPPRLDQWPSKKIEVHWPTRRRTERGNSVAWGFGLTGVFDLYQYGLASPKPNGGIYVARCGVVWTITLSLTGFPVVLLVNIRDLTSAKVDGYHTLDLILGLGTCFTNNLLQNVDGQTRHRDTKRNVLHVVVSNWGKPVPAIIHDEYLCAEINGWNNVCTFGAFAMENFL